MISQRTHYFLVKDYGDAEQSMILFIEIQSIGKVFEKMLSTNCMKKSSKKVKYENTFTTRNPKS